jgi:hypothetical protein
VDLATLEPMTVTCPRCSRSVQVRLYGPCAECVAELHAKYAGEAREVETADYVPKMNVTPNAIATKE